MSEQIANVGVPAVPQGLNLDQYELLNWLRNTVLSLQAALIPPGIVSNMRATALAGGIQIDFTRSDGDGYILYSNSTPSINGAIRIDLGASNKYVDDFGAGSIVRYYVVVAKKGNVSGAPSAWVSATSLALGAAITPPTPPPATETPFINQEYDGFAVEYLDKGGNREV